MEKLLSIKEVAELMSVHPRTVNRMINRREMPAVKVGNRWRIKPEDMVRFLDETALEEVEELLELLKRLEPEQKKQVRDYVEELLKNKEENKSD